MKNWKTSLLGGLVLATGIFGIVTDPKKASDPQNFAQLLAGIGLLTAKDHDVTGGKREQDGGR
jgi:hypothetical protein